jgi:glutamate-1-semialdehyde 2,1-aminomutase
VAVFGGRREIMQHVGQGVVHGGTYCGNRVALAAANATLDILMNTDALDVVAQRGLELQSALTEILERTGLPFVIFGHPSLFSFWFTDRAPRDFRDWLMVDHKLYETVAEGLIQRGVLPEPDTREPLFMSAAHTAQDIADTANALEDTLREVLRKR